MSLVPSSLILQLQAEALERVESYERQIAKAVWGKLDGMPVARHDTLSRRELQVFLGEAAGRPWAEIAEEMKCSVKSVGQYHIRIKEKLGLADSKAVLFYAIKVGVERGR